MKPMTNLTQGEFRMLRKIAESEYRDGDLSDVVWGCTETVEDKGYLGSLVKKGLAGVDNTTKGEETCWLTEVGISEYKRLIEF